jgi:hypothetical protein
MHTSQENLAIFKRFIRELGKGNYDIISEVCSPDFAFHSPNFPGWPRGLEGATKIAQAGAKLIKDAEQTIDDLFATEDRVVMRTTIRGTFVGEPTPGFPANGERFEMGRRGDLSDGRWKDRRRLGNPIDVPDRLSLGMMVRIAC